MTLQRNNLEGNTLLHLGTNMGHKLEPQKQRSHMRGMEEQESVCTSEGLAGLSKGALLSGLASNYFRLSHRIGHG